MKTYLKTYFRNLDYIMLFAYIMLCLFGLVMIYSSSQMVAIREGRHTEYYYDKQFFFLKFAWLGFIFCALVPFKRWTNKYFLGTTIIVLLVLETWVTFFGLNANGSRSWISLAGFTFQPTEYAKIFIIIYFASVFYKKSDRLYEGQIQKLKLNDLASPIFLWLLILAGAGMETDLGAVMILFIIAVSIMFASGLTGRTLKKFMSAILLCGSVVVIGALIFKHDRIFTSGRTGRLTSFLNPFEYADGSGFQVINGYYAIGSGGLTGLGLGQSIQKLGYLPEPHTDFIMAIIAEELGVLGVSIVLLCLGYIALKGFWIAMRAKNPITRMLAAGVSTWIGFQTFINIGGMSGLIPLTGVTLPFISYGGSSVLMLSLAVGILLNVSTLYKIESKKS